MENYSSKYEDYYNSISHKNVSGFKSERIVKRIMQELIGTFVLIVFVLLCKTIPMPQAREAYDYSKYIVKYTPNYNAIIKKAQSYDLNKVESIISNNAQYIKSKITNVKISDNAAN